MESISRFRKRRASGDVAQGASRELVAQISATVVYGASPKRGAGTVGDVDGGGRVHLHVPDTGAGIVAAHLDYHSDPFGQATSASPARSREVGLGRVIRRNLVLLC